MRRAPSLALKASFLCLGLITTGEVAAAGSAVSAAGRPSSSFNLFVAQPATASNVQLPNRGVGIASSKTLIQDPYKVPLIQNAGSLTPGR
jgi:hypothetical protein